MPVAATVGVIIMIEMSVIVGGRFFGAIEAPTPRPADYNNTAELGSVMYTVYVYPFEIAAVILLVAIIAAISLTMRKRPETKYQDPASQIGVKRADRVRLVSMAAEKK